MALPCIGSRFAKNLFFILPLILCCLFPQYVAAQNYGLSFTGQEEVVLEKRTSLNLSGDKRLCLDGDFDLSFSIRLNDIRSTNFGYVFRMINDRSENIDLLIGGLRESSENNFKLVKGETYTPISFNAKTSSLIKNWNTVRLTYSARQKKLALYFNKRLAGAGNYTLSSAACYKLFFGSHNYQSFRSTDVPSMRIRDIRLVTAKAQYHWPLNEQKGKTAHEQNGKMTAIVTNPVWIKELHNAWKQENSFVILRRNISVAFDGKKEEVYFIGLDSLHTYSVQTSLVTARPYGKKPAYLPAGNQAVYDPVNNRLWHVTGEEKKAVYYDTLTNSFSGNFMKLNASSYWHANKFISTYDTALYMLGGYGHYHYRNHINRFDLKTGKWQLFTPSKTDFKPHYMAGLGVNEAADTAYIIGGYGSDSGDQMLNPHHYYDLVQFTVGNRSFKKLYSFKPGSHPYTFANSLVIDTKRKEFYGLLFPNQTFNSFLQLVKGSLKQPGFTFSAQKIPYKFHDSKSYADLFYAKKAQKLIAVTLYRTEKNHTYINVYSLSFPPGIPAKDENTSGTTTSSPKYLAILVLLSACGFIFLGYRIIRKRANSMPVAAATVLPHTPASVHPGNGLQQNTLNSSQAGQKTRIHLFGSLQILDQDGNNTVHLFTPLLKELFLILLLSTIKQKNGITSDQLYQTLWQDKSKKDAQNNRSVNIAKLKLQLEKSGAISISKTGAYWSLDVDKEQVYIDYDEYVNILSKPGGKEKQLFGIIKKGAFLPGTTYDWLDDYKSEISNTVDDLFTAYSQTEEVQRDAAYAVELADCVFRFDPLNETALAVKCRALNRMGKHTSSKHTYEKFCKEYKSIYGMEYMKTFQAILA